MMRAICAALLLAMIAGCAPKPQDDGPLTPILEPKANPLVLPPAQDPNGGAS